MTFDPISQLLTFDSVKKFRFRNFQVYKDLRLFRTKVKNLSKKFFPKEEQFCLTQQLWRALDSIVLNIAEGTDRGSDKDFARYLNQSHTSLNEVVSCIDLALDDKYITCVAHKDCLKEAECIANQLTAFRKNLLEYPNK